MFKLHNEDINWNIHRDPVTNPIQKQKIDALLTSFEKSKNEANSDGFWKTGLGVVLCYYEATEEAGVYSYTPLSPSEVAEVVADNTPGELLVIPEGVSAHLYAGHHRLEAAKVAGIEELVVVPEYMDLRQMQIRYILENGEEYGQNAQVLIENTAQAIGIINNMLDSVEDYDAWIETYGDEGKKLYTKNRFTQLKGDAVVSANDVVKLLGSQDVSKKAIEAACKVLDAEEAGLISREEVFNFPTPRMMGVYTTIVGYINDMEAVPPAIRDFYKRHLIAEISGDLLRLASHEDDEKYEASRKKMLAKGPRVTFSQLDGVRRTLAAAKKAAAESGDKYGVDVVQAIKRAMGIKKEGDETVESGFNIKAALSSEKRCGVRWQDIIADGEVAGVEGLTDFSGVEDVVKEIDTKHAEKEAKRAKEEADGGGELQAEIDTGAPDGGDELPPMETDGEDVGEVDPEMVAQEAMANFSSASETIVATLNALATFPKLIAKAIEETEQDALEEIYVASAKVLWAKMGNRKSLEELLTKANPKTNG